MNASSIKAFQFPCTPQSAKVLLALSVSPIMRINAAEVPPSLAGVKIYSAAAEEGADLIGQRFKSWSVGE